MSSLAIEACAVSVRFGEENMCIDPLNGRSLSVPLLYLPRLEPVTPEQGSQLVISGGRTAIHFG